MSSDLSNNDRVSLHVGRYIVRSTELDFDVTLLLGRAMKAASFSEARESVRGLTAGEKQRQLRKLAPSTWVDRDRWFRAMEEVSSYRDRLAHSLIDIDMTPVEVAPDRFRFGQMFHKERPTRGGRTLAIDFDEFQQRETDLHAVLIATLSMTVVMNDQPNLLDTPDFSLGNQASGYGRQWTIEPLAPDLSKEAIMTSIERQFPPVASAAPAVWL